MDAQPTLAKAEAHTSSSKIACRVIGGGFLK